MAYGNDSFRRFALQKARSGVPTSPPSQLGLGFLSHPSLMGNSISPEQIRQNQAFRGRGPSMFGVAQLGVAQRNDESDEDYNVRSGLTRAPQQPAQPANPFEGNEQYQALMEFQQSLAPNQEQQTITRLTFGFLRVRAAIRITALIIAKPVAAATAQPDDGHGLGWYASDGNAAVSRALGDLRCMQPCQFRVAVTWV